MSRRLIDSFAALILLFEWCLLLSLLQHSVATDSNSCSNKRAWGGPFSLEAHSLTVESVISEMYLQKQQQQEHGHELGWINGVPTSKLVAIFIEKFTKRCKIVCGHKIVCAGRPGQGKSNASKLLKGPSRNCRLNSPPGSFTSCRKPTGPLGIWQLFGSLALFPALRVYLWLSSY